ncbi:Z1 domain-containing protein [Aestuariibaculum marinum]|uniref:Z1 domain-containing protein n=1 Tax=Aestuariibaculum marinum TaxID=2683592 RepID=A0A8J6U671_9FLAO|nr:Z1 domain-containing protein [Aestuariibaculum marinum]MBD0824444.1 Z1 domain-containing protein [Aestuariibaculum marinum]
MTDTLVKIFNTKVRSELEAYGTDLTEADIEDFINELPENIRVAKEQFNLDTELKEGLLNHAKKQFGFTNGSHVYIKGMGIYNDSEEIELDKENWHYYQRHKHYLLDHVFTDNADIVGMLDEETDEIIKKFPKPDKHDSFSKKGLVIGNVQSGKTANFTHLISKAASIGYKFVIVLAGMTDTLRMQTQFRIDKELIGNNTLGLEGVKLIKWLPGEEKFHSLTGLPDKKIKKDNGDFYIPVNNFTDHFEKTNDVTIAIVKKLARNNSDNFGSIIGNLINWIESRYVKDPDKMPPVLIIDDEADQASIDSSDEEGDPTVINHAIRRLIHLFPKSVYVGYTATPFANVFINPANDYQGLPDLYPKDFIYALPEPEEYFGSSRFFGIKNKDNELALIEQVDDSERCIINDEDQDITTSLTEAIDTFIYTAIVRKHRGNDKYCGMMIHTDHRNNYHNTVYSKVREYIYSLACDKTTFEGFNTFKTQTQSIGRLQGLVSEFPDYDYDTFKNEYNTILDYLKRLKGSKTSNIKVINSREDKLDYLNEELKYLICIGGNIMSRGVTIEGLTVTYYLRDTLKYDTLLQMGRWFGYRKGYEDLLRIYTTERIADHFEFVMAVEDDLRNEVRRYIEEGLTPLDFAPKVRAHMRMHPTAKMGNSSLTKSYSQQTVQTIYFDRALNVLKHNYESSKQLIEKYQKTFEKTEAFDYKFLAKKANIDDLLEFIKNYGYSRHNSFDLEGITNYIEQRVNFGEIQNFDILVSGIKQLKENTETTQIAELTVNPVKRNLRRSKGREYIAENIVNVGVISDTADIKMAEDNDTLTLILYFIDRKHSDAFNASDENYNAEALDFNPIGFTIAFPKTTIANGEIDYYQQIFN